MKSTEPKKQPDVSTRIVVMKCHIFFQICCVKPLPSPEDDSLAVEGYLIPAKIRKSRENLRVDRFQGSNSIVKN